MVRGCDGAYDTRFQDIQVPNPDPIQFPSDHPQPLKGDLVVGKRMKACLFHQRKHPLPTEPDGVEVTQNNRGQLAVPGGMVQNGQQLFGVFLI